MAEEPPDLMILQTHTHGVVEYLDLYRRLQSRCELRVHISIETDMESIPGLASHASSVARRLHAAKTLTDDGIRTVITVSPLLPIREPSCFFDRISECADAVVIDHFIEGDGTPDGRRTLQTHLPSVMAAVEPRSINLSYLDEIVHTARQIMGANRVGVNIDGFAGRYLP